MLQPTISVQNRMHGITQAMVVMGITITVSIKMLLVNHSLPLLQVMLVTMEAMRVMVTTVITCNTVVNLPASPPLGTLKILLEYLRREEEMKFH